MEKKFLDLEDVSFSFPKSKSNFFNKLNLQLNSNDQIIGILGPNGSGKSLIAKIICGLEKINSGKILVNNKNISALKTIDRLPYVSMTFQMINNTFLRHSVKDEFIYTRKIVEKINKERKITLNDENDLISSFASKLMQHPLTLSGGEKRKLYFSLLRLLDPEIYILDEPTVGLDSVNLEELKNEITRLVQKKKKILIITHDLKFLLTLTDSVVILAKNSDSKTSSVLHQGSLHKFLIESENTAKNILTVPLEYEIFRKQLFDGKLPKNTSYREFLTINKF